MVSPEGWEECPLESLGTETAFWCLFTLFQGGKCLHFDQVYMVNLSPQKPPFTYFSGSLCVCGRGGGGGDVHSGISPLGSLRQGSLRFPQRESLPGCASFDGDFCLHCSRYCLRELISICIEQHYAFSCR